MTIIIFYAIKSVVIIYGFRNIFPAFEDWSLFGEIAAICMLNKNIYLYGKYW